MNRNSLIKYFFLFFIITGFFSCIRPTAPEEPIDREALIRDSLRRISEARFSETREAVAENIRQIIETNEPGEKFRLNDLTLYSTELLTKIYIENTFYPLWVKQFDSTAKVEEMAEFIGETVYHGLIPDEYHYSEIVRELEKLKADSTLIFDAGYLSRLDLMLTDAWFLLASHLYYGKVAPEKLTAQWEIRRDKPVVPFEANLKAMLTTETVADGFRHLYPSHQGYELMVAEAKRLSVMKEGDFQIKAEIKNGSIKPGDSLPAIAEIKRKLEFLGLYTPDTLTHPDKYDEKLEVSVKKLQEQFGFNTDGAIGKNALKALNMPLEQRINQLYVNMERLRWLPDSLEAINIWVNIAGFTLEAYRGNDTLLSMRIIAGKEYRATPIFNARITYLVFSPSWTVPPTIQRKDIIPELTKDIGYLTKKNMKIYDSKGNPVDPSTVNWSKSGMKYTIRQSPGPQNSLGKVKFMFPNKYNVYLHDTPSHSLFSRDERTFSSGCIRIEKPDELAALLLADMPGWDMERIKQAMNSRAERTVVLNSPAGVYITYLTAWGNRNGTIHHRVDIYNRDEEMVKALRERTVK